MKSEKTIQGKNILKSIASLVLMLTTFVTTFSIPVQAAEYYARFNTKVTYFQDSAKSMLNMINDFRTGNESWYWEYDDKTKVVCSNLNKLEWNSELEKMAMERAKEAATYMSHTRPNGTLYATIDPSGKVKGENLAWNYSTDAAIAFNQLKEDNKMSDGQGHRRTMLDKNFKYIGVGCAKVGGNICWAQVFSINPPTSNVNFNTASQQTLEVNKSYVNGIRATLYKDVQANQTFSKSDINMALITKSREGYSAYIALENPVFTVTSKDPSVLAIAGDNIVAKKAGSTILTVSAYEYTSDISVNVKANTTNNNTKNTENQKLDTETQRVDEENKNIEQETEKTTAVSKLTTTKRSQEAIKSYILSNGTTRAEMNKSNITYAKKPDQSAPYTQIGELSAQTKSDSIKLINTIRYIAGLDADVTFNESQGQLAQAASIVNAANGYLSHSPKMPAGMNVNTYNNGKTGASKTNLYMSYGLVESLWASFVTGWMYDGDSSNISAVGHRRWILNPQMGQTGFGASAVNNKFASSMYAFDESNKNATQTNVAWPAENMPVEYFASNVPWSISLGKNVDVNQASVRLTEKGTGRTWFFSKGKADGYFNVNNSGYGLKGCVIFRPKDITGYKGGDVFDVTVTTAEFGELNYTVSFFDVTPPIINQVSPYYQFKQEAEGTVYRLYNPATGEHLYTTDVNEVKTLVVWRWIQETSQGVSASSGQAIYRLYNGHTGEHLYTSDTNEVRVLTGMGWSYDNAGKPLFYGEKSGATPVYRLYNPLLPQIASHHYTSDTNEVKVLLQRGWKYDNDGKPMYALK